MLKFFFFGFIGLIRGPSIEKIMGFKFSDPSTPFLGPFLPGTPFGLSIYQYPLITEFDYLLMVSGV